MRKQQTLLAKTFQHFDSNQSSVITDYNQFSNNCWGGYSMYTVQNQT